MPQMPSRQSESNAMASLPFDQPFVDDVEHLEERHVRRDVVAGVVLEPARSRSARLPPDFQIQSHVIL
jgi:hypothetical protein